MWEGLLPVAVYQPRYLALIHCYREQTLSHI
jgi:hypothetical protein